MARARSSTATESTIAGMRETERVARELHESAVRREKAATKALEEVQHRADEIGRAMLIAIQSPPPRPTNPSTTPGSVMFLESAPDAAMQRAAEEVAAEYDRLDAELAACRNDVPTTRAAWYAARRARRVAELLAGDDAATVRSAHEALAAARAELVAAEADHTTAEDAMERYRQRVDNGSPRDPVKRLELEAGIADADDRVTVATRRVAATTDEYRDAVAEFLADAVVEHRRSRRLAEDTASAVAERGLRELLDKISAGTALGNERGRQLSALRDDAGIRPDSIAGPEGAIEAKAVIRRAVAAL